MELSLVSVLTWHSYWPWSPGSTPASLKRSFYISGGQYPSPKDMKNPIFPRHFLAASHPKNIYKGAWSDLRLQMLSLLLMTEDILEMFDNK